MNLSLVDNLRERAPSSTPPRDFFKDLDSGRSNVAGPDPKNTCFYSVNL